MHGRFLRGKNDRNAVWIAADGRCQLCGCELPEDWHADHVIPYSHTPETRLLNIQALCPGCNLRKGTHMLRQHQHQTNQLLTQLIAKQTPIPEFVVEHICPGGGKSLLPILAAHWLIEKAKIADKICWVVPNGPLRRQAAHAFLPGKLAARLLGHHMEIVEATNVENPAKDHAGYTTTYLALVCDKSGINRKEFERHRYILVADEFHHCALNSPYHQALEPLVERSVLTILMTGTIDRGDRAPIYALPYGTDRKVHKFDAPSFRWISYGVGQATTEKAIIRVHIDKANAATKWYDSDGQLQHAETLGNSRDALFTALRTEYARELLDSCATSWLAHRRNHPRSKLLVVCADTAQARVMCARLNKRGIHAEIATYKEEEADETIARFSEQDDPPALVTVAKAYEGMDVPRITHIACLTHIRSRPWIEQMIARGWRYDADAGPWEEQFLYLFAPADEAFQKCIKDIEDEQQAAVHSLEEVRNGPKSPPGPDNPPPVVPGEITPIASRLTETHAAELRGETLTPEETAFYREAAKRCGIHASPIQAKTLMQEIERLRSEGWTPTTPSSEIEHPDATRRLELFRAELNQLVRSLASGDGEECARINAQVKRVYGPREAMTEKDLRSAISWLRQAYAARLNGAGAGHA